MFKRNTYSGGRCGVLLVGLGALAWLGAGPAMGQERPRRAAEWPVPGEPAISDSDISRALEQGVRFLVDRQESLAKPEEGEEGVVRREWPYEGVYRVGGQIPIGYRVGGTGIVGLALLAAPGYEKDEARRQAVARAAKFVVESIEHPLMSARDYDAGYDTRGWGYTYGLLFLLKLEQKGAMPEDLEHDAKSAAEFFIESIEATTIPGPGGWNYARPPGRDKAAPPSPFMTAPTLEALFEAKARGYDVDEDKVGVALKALEGGRTASGSYLYSGLAKERGRGEPTPGSVGRMLSAESTLLLAGRGSVERVRGALDAFIVHWAWLDQRRAQNGTHQGPYGVAPYYFYFAHRAASRAIEQLPEGERGEYRRRVDRLLFSVRQDDGTWNDRVFPRSAAYGTAMAMLALAERGEPAPARWTGEHDEASEEGRGEP